MRTVVIALAALSLGALASHAQLIPQNLKIRIEKADRILEPVASPSNSNCYAGKDNYFNEIEPSSGVFYGYTANGNKNSNGLAGQFSTCYMQGNQVYSMPQTYQGVIASGYPNDPSSAYASCGYWLNGTYKSGSTWYGFAHAEGYAVQLSTTEPACDYPPTTKSMGLLTSTDGINWTPQGQIIANPYENSGGTKISEYGEGDCTPVVPPSSSYLYLYCRRTKDTQTSIARAPISSNFGQSNWKKLTAPGTWGGAWNSDDYGIGLYGSSSSIFTNYGNVMLLRTELGGTGVPRGVQMSFSATNDPTTFTRVSEPLIYEDNYAFPYGDCSPNCKASGQSSTATYSDLIAYPSALSGSDGSRNWNGYFLLTYTYVPNNTDKAGAGTDSSGNIMNHGRTLVMRNVSVSQESSAQSPQVGIALSRWYSSGIKQRISTTEPVPYNYVTAGYALEQAHNGYLMTVPPASGSMTVVECVSSANFPSSANPDHLVNAYNTSTTPSNYGCDSNYAFLRTAGYLYSSSQGSSTVPVYRCKPNSDSSGNLTGPTYSHFVSNQSDCEGYGTKEYLLGYALAN